MTTEPTQTTTTLGEAITSLKEAYVQNHLTTIKRPDIFDVKTAELQFEALINTIQAKTWDECQQANNKFRELNLNTINPNNPYQNK